MAYPKKDFTKEKADADQVIRIVCDYFNVGYQEIKGKRIDRAISYPRKVCYQVLKMALGYGDKKAAGYLNRAESACVWASRMKMNDDIIKLVQIVNEERVNPPKAVREGAKSF